LRRWIKNEKKKLEFSNPVSSGKFNEEDASEAILSEATEATPPSLKEGGTNYNHAAAAADSHDKQLIVVKPNGVCCVEDYCFWGQ
jgi:hypothetical protein